MNKTKIKIEKGINYLTDVEIEEENEIKKFELPKGILNKGIPGCGATTLAIEDDNKTIICSPRNELLINKHVQYPKTTKLVIGGVNETEIKQYIDSTEIPKILVSYDSLYKLIGCIRDKSGWRVVVDEFQCLLSDSSFKSETELKFLDELKEFPYVTFMSATPILDKYLEKIDYFKDMDYTELEWEDKEKIELLRHKTPKPIDAAIAIVRKYQSGNYPSCIIDSEVIYSKECVIFLNSVNNIINIIKQTGIPPEEVNIIVGNNEENDKQIAKLGKGYKRGSIPLKNEPHKKFTFCTSTAYAGCDFYSTNATSFVISDCKRINTTVDISTDLVQIAGRQRLACNPFRKYLVFIYNTGTNDISEEEFYKMLEEKRNLTKKDITDLNGIKDCQLKQLRIKKELQTQRMLKYSDTYTMYDEKEDKFVFNNLAYINEIYNYDLQKYAYENGIIIKKQLEDSGFDTSTNQVYTVFEEHLKQTIVKQSFADRMKHYCEYKAKGNLQYDFVALSIEMEHPEIKYYYDFLGGARIKALGYKECNLKNEISFLSTQSKIKYELEKRFKSGNRIITSDLQSVLQGIYTKYSVKKPPVATDIKNYFPKSKAVKIPTADGRKNGWEIIY